MEEVKNGHSTIRASLPYFMQAKRNTQRQKATPSIISTKNSCYSKTAWKHPPLVDSLKHFDVIVLWTWKSDDLKDLEKNLARLEAVKPKDTKIALGLYLWDYTGVDEQKKADPTYRFGKPTPLDLMELQCGLGLKWLKEGRVRDLVILGNTHLDIGAPSAPWMRQWIKQHGAEKLGR